jgi:hypothetical protein
MKKSPHPKTRLNLTPRSAKWWEEHFRNDLRRDWTIPWDPNHPLATGELARIAASIAEFQRGESSEARSYLTKSAAFSQRVNEPAFHTASKLFIAAENAHADLLRRFMQQVGIPVAQKSSRDGVFRWLRHLGDLGWTTRVLLIAELVAQEYYPCLRAGTQHPALVRLCDRIIAEEAAHIRFQVERIAQVETGQKKFATILRDAAQKVLVAGTAGVVYAGHGRVLSVRWSFAEFFGRVWARNHRAIAAVQALRDAVVVGPRARSGPGDDELGARTETSIPASLPRLLR